MNRRPPSGDRPKVPKVRAEAVASQAGDRGAEGEAKAFAEGTLEEQSRRGEHRRSERFRDQVANVAVAVIWILFALFVIAMLVLGWHYLAPESWGWLDQDQLSTLKTVVFSGAITSTATAYFAGAWVTTTKCVYGSSADLYWAVLIRV